MKAAAVLFWSAIVLVILWRLPIALENRTQADIRADLAYYCVRWNAASRAERAAWRKDMTADCRGYFASRTPMEVEHDEQP